MEGLQTILSVLLTFFGVVASLYGGFKVFIKYIWPRMQGAAVFTKDFFGSVMMMPQAVKSLKQIETMDSMLTKVYTQVMPDNGSTMRDSLNRTEAKMDRISNDVALLSSTLKANGDADPNLAMFEANNFGENVWVSRTYCRWVNRSEDELLGWGFMNVIPLRERERVRDEWHTAMGEKRQYQCQHNVMGGDGSEILVDVTATPIPYDGEPQRWIGSIRRVTDYSMPR
ncbi:MAG: PAS domain-containing protein [Gallionella sp.]